jgi:hypothetical protein
MVVQRQRLAERRIGDVGQLKRRSRGTACFPAAAKQAGRKRDKADCERSLH